MEHGTQGDLKMLVRLYFLSWLVGSWMFILLLLFIHTGMLYLLWYALYILFPTEVHVFSVGYILRISVNGPRVHRILPPQHGDVGAEQSVSSGSLLEQTAEQQQEKHLCIFKWYWLRDRNITREHLEQTRIWGWLAQNWNLWIPQPIPEYMGKTKHYLNRRKMPETTQVLVILLERGSSQKTIILLLV